VFCGVGRIGDIDTCELLPGSVVGVGHCYQVEVLYRGKGSGVAGVEGEVVADGDGGDHGVIGAGRRLLSGCSEVGRNSAKRAGSVSIEWQWFEVGFGLLEVSLPRGTFVIGGRNQRADGEFGKGDSGDLWFGGERRGFGESSEEDEGFGVEDSSGHVRGWGRVAGQGRREVGPGQPEGGFGGE